jgi:micrococcal nuclease
MFQEILSTLIATLIFLFPTYIPSGSDTALQSTPAVTVLSVIDGDTIKVRIGEKEETVRYIGIDTPEPYRDGEPACFSREATEENKRLVEGKEVKLVGDKEDRDKYGRLLRYVYVGDTFVNAEMVENGFAKILRIKPNTEHASELSTLQEAAREAKRGLWKECSE